jgi:hypothetical protein
MFVFLTSAFLRVVGSTAVALFTAQWILLCHQRLPQAVYFIQQADDAWLTTLFQFSKGRTQMYVSPEKEYADMSFICEYHLLSKNEADF